MTPIKINIPVSRSERIKEIKALFPHHTGANLREDWVGGRTEGLKRLSNIKPERYEKSRNYLNGEVTYLSPYLRHGCISLAEAITFAQEKSTRGNDKLLFEFAWRDYWRQIWYHAGDRIHSEMEAPKVELKRNSLPRIVSEGNTKLPCIDHFVNTLRETGYLHNHARMWLSSYLIHWLGVDWKIAANWMHDMLLDGDQASNTLSWQWVASTFGSKPYFFNQENLSKYTGNQLCNGCQAVCPFKKSYEALDASLFRPTTAPARITSPDYSPINFKHPGNASVILFTDEMLSPAHALYQRNQKKIFVFDPIHYKNWSLNRLQFMADCLAEMPEVEVWTGDTLALLEILGCGHVETQSTPNSMLRHLLSKCSVTYIEEPAIYSDVTKEKLHARGLMRFSKYWNFVGEEILKR
ncbi:FAD-binding domain-containing protein [Candidatus Methylopumilus turicensis]|uniref:DNA photolyase FAD-binding protein n=1 Tax=Candidatus Methylopumilus turicensis TaxID=1581680 RepID=A0A0B7ITS8_9PROT|nr:FAD-binding domain-containing protein [Candidatus Methylopumilus turicensis]CEN55685.1 DNA photolyase FAD-binding protein [Candidatus Methylopumilus turicensis]